MFQCALEDGSGPEAQTGAGGGIGRKFYAIGLEALLCRDFEKIAGCAAYVENAARSYVSADQGQAEPEGGRFHRAGALLLSFPAESPGSIITFGIQFFQLRFVGLRREKFDGAIAAAMEHAAAREKEAGPCSLRAAERTDEGRM